MSLVRDYREIGNLPTAMTSRQVKATPKEAIWAEADLPTIETTTTQLHAIAFKKSKKLKPSNPRHQIAEQIIRQRTKNSSSRTKAEAVWTSSFGPFKLFLSGMEIGGHIFETSGSKLGDMETEKKWAYQRLEKRWSTFDLVLFTDGLQQKIQN